VLAISPREPRPKNLSVPHDPIKRDLKSALGGFRANHGRMTMQGEIARYEQVEVAERKDQPGAWTVEAIDDDGGIEQAIFIGPNARERASEYKKVKYDI
jgi:hypothetical protein